VRSPCFDLKEEANGRVPLYAISSLIAIFSLEAAFFIDAVRDLYEASRARRSCRSTANAQAFVIYTFFQLLITYLGGERSLLIILHGRHPIPHPFPVNLFLRPMDVSDPWTLLNLKRGVLRESGVSAILAKLIARIRPDQAVAGHRYGHLEIDR